MSEQPLPLNACVVVFPNAEGLAWRAAVVEAARAAGVAVIPDSTIPADGQGAVYLRDSMDEIGDVPTRTVVVILSPRTLSPDRAMLEGALSFLARADSRSHDITFIVGDESGGGVLSLSPGFEVKAPYPSCAIASHQASELGALAIYREGSPGVGARAAWAPSIFLYDSKAAENGTRAGDLELAGRARCLFHGPYLTLPAGTWASKVRFTVDQAASERNFRFEWGGAGGFAQLSFSPGKPGVYEAVLTHAWDRPEPSELRLILPESALAGQFELLSVDVEMIELAPAKVAA